MRFSWINIAATLLGLFVAFAVAASWTDPGHRDFLPFVVFLATAMGGSALYASGGHATARNPVPWKHLPQGYGPAPRTVRFSTRSMAKLPGTAVGILGVPTAWALMAGTAFESRLALLVALSFVWLGVPLIFAAIYARERRLMALGETTLAYVESRSPASRDYSFNARLRFSFEANGKVYSDWGRDCGYFVQAGSTVPIFFDPANPKKRWLLACESFYEVVEDEALSGDSA